MSDECPMCARKQLEIERLDLDIRRFRDVSYESQRSLTELHAKIMEAPTAEREREIDARITKALNAAYFD